MLIKYNLDPAKMQHGIAIKHPLAPALSLAPSFTKRCAWLQTTEVLLLYMLALILI